MSMTDRPTGPTRPAGPTIVRADWVATAVFAAAMALTAALPDEFVAIGVAVSGLLFAAGIVIFAVAYARAVQRSRTDELDLPGLFFLVHSAPAAVQRSMMGALVAQLVVGIGAAALRPFTPLAFGTLVPVFGLAMAALWSATHGSFPPRRQLERRPRGDTPAPPRGRASGDGGRSQGSGRAGNRRPRPAAARRSR
jgi:hypothetical protein